MSLFQAKQLESVSPRPSNLPVSVPVPLLLTPAAAIQPQAGAIPSGVKPAATSLNGSREYLGAGSKIKGVLYFETPAQIDGQVEGEIRSDDLVAIGESAVVTAQITARSVVVAGEVKGDIVAAHRIELRDSARVMGNITAPKLVVQPGAWFEGHCGPHRDDRSDGNVTVDPETRPASASSRDGGKRRWFGLKRKHA